MAYELIRRFTGGNDPPAEVPRLLSAIFDAQDYVPSLEKLQEQDLGIWLERLDQTIDSGILDEQLRKRALRSLRKTCGSRRILPKSHYFPGKLSKASNRPMYGGTADVWRATNDRGEIFAAKVFRAYHGEEHKIKRYYKELTVWKRLNHTNVVPTLGAGPDIAELCVVSPWMPDGDLLQYLKNPRVDRVSIMFGVADGLSYLHSNGVVHGDLKGPNILFDSAGIPRIGDFGASSITFDPVSKNASTPSQAYSLRWAAPEILEAQNDESRRPTKKSDVYAFAMVVVEIFTGKVPFPDISDLNVHLMVTGGRRPPKPADASELGRAWKIVEECWNKKRDKRPEIQNALLRIHKAIPPKVT